MIIYQDSGNGGYECVDVTKDSICEDVLYHTGKQA